MAIAKYFSKNALAISQVLNGGSINDFKDTLNNSVVGIAFDKSIMKKEGLKAVDLLVRLFSRLYPKISFINLSGSEEQMNHLVELAKSINSEIEIVDVLPSVTVALMECELAPDYYSGPIFYIGSDRWIAKLSSQKPMSIGDSNNALGSGFAACIAAANVFRHVFASYLPPSRVDQEFIFSLASMDTNDENPDSGASLVDLGKVHLVGIGAIGNGVLWALGNTTFLKMELVTIEPENLDDTNLQRYILAKEEHVGKHKAELVAEVITSPNISHNPVPYDWTRYVNDSGWDHECIMVAVDSAKDRIGIQSSLPHEIINAYTGINLVGISRHHGFGKDACLACLYMPSEQQISMSQEVASNLNIPESEIRDYLYTNKDVDENLLRKIADANAVSYDQLAQFLGTSTREFYSKFVCGGMLIELRQDNALVKSIEAPLAFQSALAGIMQAADLILFKAGYRKAYTSETQLNPIAPIKAGQNPQSFIPEKDSSGRCLCSDELFLSAYERKWEMLLTRNQ